MKEKEEGLEEGKIYEIGFHILPTVPEEKVQEVFADIRNLIDANGGTFISDEFPKMRVLAYEIRKRIETKYLSFNKAYFGWVKFEVEPSVISKIKKSIESNENILRFLIIKTVKENTLHVFRSSVPSKENIDIVSKEPTEKIEVSEAEIDKSIEELVIN